jgi:probable HAF family extracellular repeat protein
MYRIIDLHEHSNPWGDSSRANAFVDDASTRFIVGEAWNKSIGYATSSHAVAWDRNRQMIGLGNPAPPTTLALSVNQGGGVVGSAVRPLGDNPRGHGFYCNIDDPSKMSDLPMPQGQIDIGGAVIPSQNFSASFGRAISDGDGGVIVGHLEALPTLGFRSLAAWWHQQGPNINNPTFLPTLRPPGSKAAAINKNGTIIGWAGVDSTGASFHACRWKRAGTKPIYSNPPEALYPASTLLGKVYAQSYAWAISHNEIIVGASGDSIENLMDLHACVWKPGSNTAELLYKQAATKSIAYGVNSLGKIVGLSISSSGVLGAFFHPDPRDPDPSQPSLDPCALKELLDPSDPKSNDWSELSGARDINDAGEIVGVGKVLSGDTHAFLMTPI